ncbi:MAG: cohesin domain-containing protein [Candidatus Methanoperedens sp.]|nr:cohesin domain-containing protein [Candidatus Methanoperedens sp.]CAG0991922.1 hypothetical protein METP1_02343 [Methanosarcinales archaeon]
MKRSMIIIIFLFALIGQAAGLTVSMSDAGGAKGGITKVPLNISDALALGSMDIVLKYDPSVLRAMTVEGKRLGENAYIEANSANKGEVAIALADSRGINGDGTFATVTFEVLGGIGSTSPLTIEKVTAHNIDLSQISATTSGGIFKVTSEAPREAGDDIMVMLAITAVSTALMLIRWKEKEKR